MSSKLAPFNMHADAMHVSMQTQRMEEEACQKKKLAQPAFPSLDSLLLNSIRYAFDKQVNKRFLSSNSVYSIYVYMHLVHLFYTAYIMIMQVVLLGGPSGDSGVAGHAGHVLGGQCDPQTL